jgi:hypothetical protein
MTRHAGPTSSAPRPRRAALVVLLLLSLPAATFATAHADDPHGAQQKPGDQKPGPKPDAGAPVRPGSDERTAPTGNPECVHVRTEARYIPYGYDHIVEIDNTCKKAVDCTITTDVNPSTSNLSVPPGQKGSITTFRGSPAREFKANAACKERD